MRFFGVEILPNSDALHDTFGKIDIVDVTLHHRILQVVVQAFRRRLIGVMCSFSQRVWAML
jgi:hypothetical protein